MVQPLATLLVLVPLGVSYSPLTQDPAETTLAPIPSPTRRPLEPSEHSPSASWQAQVEGDLQLAEFTFQPVPGESGVWSAPNRSQELRSRLSVSGLEVFPRETSEEGEGAPWKLRLRTGRFGRLGDLRELGHPAVTIHSQQVELDHGLLVEWFENREQGIEQGWTIATRPHGMDPLWIGLEIEGELHLRIEAGARSGVLVDSTGETHLRYRDLKAYDATGTELHAELVSSSAGVGIRVDDAGAIYPLTVDPLLTGPAWTSQGYQPGALFGTSVATAGDVNNDGYDDVIFGAPSYDNGQVNEGRAFLFLGSACDLVLGWTDEGNQANAFFGQSVSTAGDVNGDSYDDVIVGAPNYDNGQTDEGRAFVYLGSAVGLAASPVWRGESNQSYARFGYSVATAGDVDNNGFSDVIVGAYLYDNGHIDEGRVFVYRSLAGVLSTSTAWKAEINQNGAQFGYCVATAGDVNNDGYDDVVIGSPRFDAPPQPPQGKRGGFGLDSGQAYAYLGSPSGLSTAFAWKSGNTQAGANFGFSVSAAGDVNGDGYSDVIVGAPFYDNPQADEGRAFVYLGKIGGLYTSAIWSTESNQAGAQFGWSVASAGNVNGDAFSDVIVGARLYDNGQTNEGRAYLYLGKTGGVETAANWIAESQQVGAQFGASVTTAGDTNGDSYSDVIVGAASYNGGQTDEGRVFVYRGSAANQPTLLSNYSTPGQAVRVAVAGSVAFVADYTSGLQIIDVSNTASPALLGSYDTPGLAYGVAVVGTVAYVADTTSLQIIDVSNLASPTLLGSFDMPGGANGVAVLGTVAYVAGNASGLQIIDVSNSASPTLLGSYDTGFAYGVAVVGTVAYVADNYVGLEIIDVSNPASPTLLGAYYTPNAAFNVTVVGTVAYVAAVRLQIIDVSNPTSPALLGTYYTPDTAWGIAVAGTKAYVGSRFCGLQIIDVSTPASPTLLGSYDTLDALGIAVVGAVVFLADTYPGLKIFLDVTP